MANDLECRALVKSYGAFTAVNGVSLAVPKGSFFSILGPSGCGKTSLMRMIAGFIEPTAGEILIGGRSMRGVPPNRRPANMVFQHLALFPMMNVADNIGYGLRRRGMAKAEIARRVGAVLERIDLADSGPKRIDQLSGGQKQRVAIARCMVLEPTVLLLDEPLGALDLKLREHMKVELKQLQHQFGTTFVYITHDQSEALVMSDQVAVMNAGRFEQVGTPEDLYYRPATPFVAGFVGDSHRWGGRVTAQAGSDLRVATSAGLALRATAVVPLAEGAAASVFVRPEAIEVRVADGRSDPAPASADVNVFAGRLESLLFNGANSRAMIRLERGDLIGAVLPQNLLGTRLGEGAAVEIRFAAAATLAFPAGGDAP
ncbi:spermidine/putrescine transport system ATP-binding protein [Angulomicrobium tetraedrale]|uniref:Spermidine/putrescine transport system ATP-binding protein n=1 Tax=Ancylobacter tetraedralis TaxID=217068 RepID=A0A839ZCZ1_9HYPH|nr:ABC transporter ATP-binding protein [Ancylobacter tetraedralis]MBB3772653.1 spermidine/putrescine transport system ATP-binding protein [Ancylobacter tetraedralis]